MSDPGPDGSDGSDQDLSLHSCLRASPWASFPSCSNHPTQPVFVNPTPEALGSVAVVVPPSSRVVTRQWHHGRWRETMRSTGIVVDARTYPCSPYLSGAASVEGPLCRTVERRGPSGPKAVCLRLVSLERVSISRRGCVSLGTLPRWEARFDVARAMSDVPTPTLPGHVLRTAS